MRIVLIFVLISSSFGCKTNAPAKSQSAPTIPSVIVDRNYAPDRTAGKYKISSWSVEGDILTVGVGFSGCPGSTFSAHFNGAWMKSMPPKATIVVERHSADNDNCREMQKETLKFDLKTMRYEGQKKVTLNSSIGSFSADYSF
jgi:hypothetical protein